MKKLFLQAIIFMFVITNVNAQTPDTGNIIPNGGFEEWDGNWAIGWNLPQYLFSERVSESRPGGAGQYSLKIYLNAERIGLSDFIPVKGGQKYVFSFWYKGSISNDEIVTTILWKDEAIVGREEFKLKTVEGQWIKKEIEVTAPASAKTVNFRLGAIDYYKGFLLLDDISMIPSGSEEPAPPSLSLPQRFIIKTFQGEMEMSWNASDDKEIKWEVTINNKLDTVIGSNSYIKTKLKPGTEYNSVKLRAVKGNLFSDYVEKGAFIRPMSRAEDSEDRIPYLRTIPPGGRYRGTSLPLYYNELANPDAVISYKLNGKEAVPKNGVLDLSGLGERFRLDIHINEGNDREWDIVYPELILIK